MRRPLLYVLTFIISILIVTSWAATGLATGNVLEQSGGEETFEDSCNQLGIEWEYSSVYKVDGERVNYGPTDFWPAITTQYPAVNETVTINCYLEKGLFASSEEKVTVNINETDSN